ncbi:unnamed protein product [Tetraodon nigroviridis]|uniref:Chromosome 9 SCAF15033, whole genome shotgun sequence n=1 Tax=Tetraodon nigroviridis TaxID=99883 RepID=Q4RK27_TETNG|nr:unnamed protein product [Tetraodon nigroviridis]
MAAWLVVELRADRDGSPTRTLATVGTGAVGWGWSQGKGRERM